MSEVRSITKAAVRGAALSVATGIVTRALGLVGTLLLIRFLVPAEYGEVSAASILVLSANQFSTLGVGMYVLAYPKADRKVLFHATLWHVVIGLFAIVAVMALRHRLGPLFDAPGLARFVPGLALAMLFDRLSFMPERILVRDLRFGHVTAARTAGELGYTFVSVATAMAGFGGLAIVYGSVCRSLLKLAIFFGSANWRDYMEPHRLHGGIFRTLIGYGSAVSLAGIASFGARRWDNLLVSRLFGPATMGQYNVAYNLADVPAAQVGEQITDVLLASFGHIDETKRADALVRTCTVLALLMFPLAVGMGATAPSIVHTFFGPKWLDVAPMLMLLSVLSVPRPIAAALTAYLHSMKRPQSVMWLEWASVAVLLGGIATLGSPGPRWACLAVGVAFNLKALGSMWLVRRYDRIPIRRFLSALFPPFLACIPMLAVVVVVRHALRFWGFGGPGLSLAVEVTLGALCYVAGALLIASDASKDVIHLARSALGRARAEEAS